MLRRLSPAASADATNLLDLAVGPFSPYPIPVGAWLRRRGDRPRLRLAWSLGAFAREGDISPLYVFFEVINAGQSDVELTRLYVAPRGNRQPVYEGPFEEERDLPHTWRRGDAVRFWVRAKTLARVLKEAGYAGGPRVKLVVEDGLGNYHEEGFRFRVDEYLRLKDE
jgi:hypothetical protein